MTQEREHLLVKELALEFVSTKDSSIFVEIVMKVDRLLLYTIHKTRRRRPYLRTAKLQDLYNTALVGLYKALLKAKKDEPGSKLISKITRYVTNEIIQDNKRSKEKLITPSVEDRLIDDTLVYKNLEMEFIRERFWKLIDENVISFEEFEMLIMRFVDDSTYKDIAEQFDSSDTTVSKKIDAALSRIRYEFRRRGWEGI